MKFGDLLSFDKFVAPFLIKIIYWIGLVMLVLGFIGSLGAMGSMGVGGFFGFILSLIGLVLAALAWRVLCEIWIVIFSINDRLGNLGGEGPKS
jgi:hypothetical protein